MAKGEEGEIFEKKLKEGGGSSSIKCPILTSTNYTVWAIKMRTCLKVNKVWKIVETGEDDEEKNDTTMALLFQAIPESFVLQVGDLSTAKEIWEAIKTRYVGADRVRDARLQTLMAQFDRLKMKESDKIDDFAGKLSEIASKSAALGAEIEESKIVKKFLKSLPRKKFIQIVASIEQMLDLNTISFEDIIGRLKAYEESKTSHMTLNILDTSCDSFASTRVYEDECLGSSLCLLDLYDCGGITQLSFKWLKKPFFPRLKWLGITGSVNRDIVDALARRRPHLKVSCRGEELGNEWEDDWDSADIHQLIEAQDELGQWILGVVGDVEMEDAEDDSEDEGSEEEE